MKFKTLLLLALLSLSSFSATAANLPGPTPSNSRGFGLGIVLGEPTGLSAKLWLSGENALDFGLSFSFDDYLLLFSDYLFHFNGALGRSSAFVSQLTPYVGVGGVLAFANSGHYDKDRHFFRRTRDSVGFGVRIPVGIEWLAPRVPLGVFIELVPGLSLVPATSGFIEGGIGIRYYF